MTGCSDRRRTERPEQRFRQQLPTRVLPEGVALRVVSRVVLPTSRLAHPPASFGDRSSGAARA
jgi:hypothetical protein